MLLPNETTSLRLDLSLSALRMIQELLHRFIPQQSVKQRGKSGIYDIDGLNIIVPYPPAAGVPEKSAPRHAEYIATGPRNYRERRLVEADAKAAQSLYKLHATLAQEERVSKRRLRNSATFSTAAIGLEVVAFVDSGPLGWKHGELHGTTELPPTRSSAFRTHPVIRARSAVTFADHSVRHYDVHLHIVASSSEERDILRYAEDAGLYGSYPATATEPQLRIITCTIKSSYVFQRPQRAGSTLCDYIQVPMPGTTDQHFLMNTATAWREKWKLLSSPSKTVIAEVEMLAQQLSTAPGRLALANLTACHQRAFTFWSVPIQAQRTRKHVEKYPDYYYAHPEEHKYDEKDRKGRYA